MTEHEHAPRTAGAGTDSRASAPARAVDELASVLVDEQDLPHLLCRVAELAVRTIAHCTAASVTLVQAGLPTTVAQTAQLALDADHAQYTSGQGPCLDAMRLQQITRFRGDEDNSTRWPHFAASARDLGVSDVLAAPLVASSRSVGALNMFCATGGCFDDVSDVVVELFSAQAAVALANVRLYAESRLLSAQLSEAMASRSLIEQAKGVLMARGAADEDAAFDQLRLQSQRVNRKLRDVATDVVASTGR